MDVCPFKTLETPIISEIEETSLNTYVFLSIIHLLLVNSKFIFTPGKRKSPSSVLLLSLLFFSGELY